MHQRKDWKTYSRFANSLIAECPDLEGVLACGTDGEKALIDGLKRNFRFALLLRCFIHFKDNLKRELERRGISTGAKRIFLDEIFEEQEELNLSATKTTHNMTLMLQETIHLREVAPWRVKSYM